MNKITQSISIILPLITVSTLMQIVSSQDCPMSGIYVQSHLGLAYNETYICTDLNLDGSICTGHCNVAADGGEDIWPDGVLSKKQCFQGEWIDICICGTGDCTEECPYELVWYNYPGDCGIPYSCGEYFWTQPRCVGGIYYIHFILLCTIIFFVIASLIGVSIHPCR